MFKKIIKQVKKMAKSIKTKLALKRTKKSPVWIGYYSPVPTTQSKHRQEDSYEIHIVHQPQIEKTVDLVPLGLDVLFELKDISIYDQPMFIESMFEHEQEEGDLFYLDHLFPEVKCESFHLDMLFGLDLAIAEYTQSSEEEPITLDVVPRSIQRSVSLPNMLSTSSLIKSKHFKSVEALA